MAVKFGLAIGATHRRAARCSRARTTSIPTCRRATRSASTSSRSSSTARSTIVLEDGIAQGGRRHARASRGGRGQVAARGLRRHDAASTSTAPARRCSRSSPSPTCARPAKPIAYMKKIHTLVRYLEICDGNMQEGSFRCDANVSVRPKGEAEARHALRDQEPELVPLRRDARSTIEVERQIELIEGGGSGRAGDAPLRSRPRRDAPDARARRKPTTIATSRIPTCCRSRLDDALVERVATALPELPDAKAARFAREHGLFGVRRGRADREPRARSFLRARRRGHRRRAQARRELGDGRALGMR